MFRAIALSSFTALVLLAAQPAAAQVLPGYPSQYFGMGWGGHSLEYIPYFAQHPPVYYSRPVPRTYGYSPYAYPPGTRTPDVQWIVPEVIMNPFVPGHTDASQRPVPRSAARRALQRENPFAAASHLGDAT